MKTPWLFGMILAFEASAGIAQMTTISSYSSSGGLGPVTTISPLGNGFSYTTMGGPNGGNFGSVQVTGGNNVSAAVLPQGRVVPIVTPAAVQPAPPSPSYQPAPLIPAPAPVIEDIEPVYIPVPVEVPPPVLPAGPSSLPKKSTHPAKTADPAISKMDPDAKEFSRLFAYVTDRDQFWRDFYRDWKVPPKTSLPIKEVIPYLRLWIHTHGPTP